MGKNFSLPGFERRVGQALGNLIAESAPGRRVAVLDADGTLWRGDVGEAFFRHQLERKSIPGAPSRDPWGKYFAESMTKNAARAYGWLAQWNAGVSESLLSTWSEQFVREAWAPQVIEPMRGLTHALLNAGFEVWVISASIRWVVQAGVKGFGIQPDRVLATSVEVEGGALTSHIAGVVPYDAGKLKLIDDVIRVRPLFAAGNTIWDEPMMAASTRLALAVRSEKQGDPGFEPEERLWKRASTRGWLQQAF